LLLVFITAFIGALMIGRTPELSQQKDIVPRHAVRPLCAAPLAGADPGLRGRRVGAEDRARQPRRWRPHGLSEIVYAYASSAADNGSSFAGLSANTLWYNITTGLAMFLGRFAHAIPILAIAGSLAAKKKAKPSAGTMPTDGPLFIGFLLAVVAILTLLQYLPALALGPIAEHFLASQGATF
jgi:K+-transporting ATPase ATPase A chain